MRHLRMLLVAGTILSLAIRPDTAFADHACDSTVVPVAGLLYVVIDDPNNEHGGIWIYQESNGQADLQRNDDSCAGDPTEPSDTVIF